MNRRFLLAHVPALLAGPLLTPVEPIWSTAYGTKIPLSRLSDDHLQNIERMLREDMPDGWREEFKVPIIREIARRGLKTKPA